MEESTRIVGSWRGLPYKGRPVLVRDGDPDHMLPTLVREASARQFSMASPSDRSEYDAILNKVAAGGTVISQDIVTYDQSSGAYICFLRWIDEYYTDPVVEPAHTVTKVEPETEQSEEEQTDDEHA